MNYSKKIDAFHESDENFSDLDTSEDSERDGYEPRFRDSDIADILSVFDLPDTADKKVTGKKVTDAETADKKVTKPALGTDAADKETLKTIRDFGLARVVAGRGTVQNFSTPTSTPSTDPKAPTDTPTDDALERFPTLPKTLPPGSFPPHGKPKRTANTNRLPRWRDTGKRKRLKFGIALESLRERSHAFTMLFGPSRLQELLDSPKGFAANLARYINRALERKLGYVPEYCFVVEATERGKLHIHGGIASTPDLLPLIEEALNHVGGKDWKPARYGETQVKLKPLFYPNGWGWYSFKDEPKARRIINGETVFISRPLVQSAEKHYAALKNKVEGRK